MIGRYLKSHLVKNRDLILEEARRMDGFIRLLMKQRNTGIKWPSSYPPFGGSCRQEEALAQPLRGGCLTDYTVEHEAYYRKNKTEEKGPPEVPHIEARNDGARQENE